MQTSEMQMTEVLDKLKGLQDVLAEKYDIEAKVAELPKSLEDKTEVLERSKKEFIDKNSTYEEEKAKVAELKMQLEEAEKSREAGEKSMDSIKTHREYEVLDKQISEAQAKEDSIRKELQKEEKKLAEINDDLKSEEELIADLEKDAEEVKENMEKDLAKYNAELVNLSEQEKQMSEGIDSETIFKFQRIIQRNRKGIVAVKGNVCDGCHMILPAQFANEIRSGKKILFCPYCSRILYYEESVDSESNFFSLEATGSLAYDDDSPDLEDNPDLLSDSVDSVDLDDADATDGLQLMDADD